jgi:integron integrase
VFGAMNASSAKLLRTEYDEQFIQRVTSAGYDGLRSLCSMDVSEKWTCKMQLKEELRRKIKAQGKSPKTWETYWHYCEDFIKWLRDQNGGTWVHPKDVGRDEIEGWLSWLANHKHVSKNSQNTALQALLYLYRELFGVSIEGVNAMRAKRPVHTREVLSVEDVAKLFNEMEGVELLAAQLMYGCGLRISDAVGLRLKDLNFERCQLSIKAGKGDKWRYTSFPEVIHDAVKKQIESVKVIWRWDRDHNPGGVSLPDAYRRKAPRAANELRWYWLFPGENLSRGEEGVTCRHHRHQDHIARRIKEAADRAGILTRVTSHVLRHSYATHAHEQGVSARTLMQLLGHESIETTEIYLHADKRGATAARSPLESLLANPQTVTEARHEQPQPQPQSFQLRVFAG